MKNLAIVLLALTLGAAPQDAKKKILFFTKSSGFEHSAIKKKGEEPSHAEKILAELAKKNNWDVTHTKDGGVFTVHGNSPETIKAIQEWASKPMGACCAHGHEGDKA